MLGYPLGAPDHQKQFHPLNQKCAVPPASPATTQFRTLLGIAVEPSGSLLVYEAKNTVYEYSDSGGLVEKFSTDLGTETPGLAVDSGGDLYTNFGGDLVLKFEPATGTTLDNFGNQGTVSGLAIDSATSNLFVDRAGSVAQADEQNALSRQGLQRLSNSNPKAAANGAPARQRSRAPDTRKITP